MNDRQHDGIISQAIKKLSELTGEDFHGYRSEVWNVISTVIDEVSKPTAQPTETCKWRRDNEAYEGLVNPHNGIWFSIDDQLIRCPYLRKENRGDAVTYFAGTVLIAFLAGVSTGCFISAVITASELKKFKKENE